MEKNLIDLFASNSNSKNLNYNSLYKFVKANTKDEKKTIRKKIQNLELSHINSTFLKVLIDSGFFADNKAREKFAYLLPAFADHMKASKDKTTESK